jgi:L-cysteine:1D-myo-inositol 2-amino-2-deoxy-alpha-D-glucopyranoside ligase
MARSAERVARWRQAAGGALGDCIDAVRDCLADDLDTPGALAAVDEAAVGGQDVTEACALLGLLLD